MDENLNSNLRILDETVWLDEYCWRVLVTSLGCEEMCVRVANENTERKLKKDRERAKTEHVSSNYAMLLLTAMKNTK